MRATEVELANVFKDGYSVGYLRRTATGCVFGYNPDGPRPDLAFHLPYRKEPYEHPGDNLPPFFANLLPEGARLNALVARAKTSSSDMFSLLMEAGPECVGDVWAVPEGAQSSPLAGQITFSSLPEADFSETLDRVLQGADDAAIPGVQEKLSISEQSISLPVNASAGFAILKLSPTAFPHLVENEAFFLGLAKLCGFKVNDAKIVTDRKGRTGLLVTRFDRVWREGFLHRIHQEDGCQIANRYPADKYRLTLRDLADSIVEFAAVPQREIVELLHRYAFAWVIGNGDLHAKNLSLYRSPKGLIEQTPLYDIVSTLAYPKLDQRMAIKMDGRDDNFQMKYFVAFGERYGVREAAVTLAINKTLKRLKPLLPRLETLPYEKKTLDRMQNQIERRIAKLES